MLRVRKWGNSAAVRLPADMLKQLDFKIGDALVAEVHNGELPCACCATFPLGGLACRKWKRNPAAREKAGNLGWCRQRRSSEMYIPDKGDIFRKFEFRPVPAAKGKSRAGGLRWLCLQKHSTAQRDWFLPAPFHWGMQRLHEAWRHDFNLTRCRNGNAGQCSLPPAQISWDWQIRKASFKEKLYPIMYWTMCWRASAPSYSIKCWNRPNL